MNRKKILILAILLAFAATAGTYAYTYSLTAAMSPAVFSTDADIATYEPASYQPEWNSILVPPAKKDKIDTKGDVPIGDLFAVNPQPSFTGDLLVRVYLLNVGDLVKAYTYLNMELYLPGSVESLTEPPYLVLSLANGVATFNLEGGSGSPTVSVIGGSYGLVSNKPDKWEDGWTVVPELSCEVLPR